MGKGSWYSIQASVDFQTDCTVEVRKLSRLTFFLPLKEQVPCPSWKFVQQLTVALLCGSFKNDIG